MGSTNQMTGSSYQGLSSGDAATVRGLIQQLLSGGTADYKALRATRNANMVDLQQLAQDYTNEAAFSDAADLMALNLQQSMEKQMPAIAKAVQGAGTSSSSMQALMSNKIAQDAALGAGALGAEQAKAYAGALANMQGTIEQYTRGGDENAQNLVNALGLLRYSQQNQQSTGSSWSDAPGGGSSGGSGGSRTSGGGTGGSSGSDSYFNRPSTGGGGSTFGGGGSTGGSGSITITPSGGGSTYDPNQYYPPSINPDEDPSWPQDPWTPPMNDFGSPGDPYNDPGYDPYGWGNYDTGTYYDPIAEAGGYDYYNDYSYDPYAYDYSYSEGDW